MLFKEISKDLDSKISGGHYPPGTSLPTEAELQSQYQVSRTTIRKAVDQLVSQGKVIRKKGSGLFIAPKISKQNILEMTGVIKPSYLAASDMVKINDSYFRLVGSYYSLIFDISPQELLYNISFIASIKGKRTLEQVLLPLYNFPDFDASCLKVVPIIEAVKSGKEKPVDLFQNFQLVEATEEVSKQLQIEKNVPVFKTTNLFSTKDSKVVAVEYRLQDALTTRYSVDFS